jgi:hypothetical protein
MNSYDRFALILFGGIAAFFLIAFMLLIFVSQP